MTKKNIQSILLYAFLATILSLFLGIFSRVSFSMLILRSLLFFIVAGTGGIVVMYIFSVFSIVDPAKDKISVKKHQDRGNVSVHQEGSPVDDASRKHVSTTQDDSNVDQKERTIPTITENQSEQEETFKKEQVHYEAFASLGPSSANATASSEADSESSISSPQGHDSDQKNGQQPASEDETTDSVQEVSSDTYSSPEQSNIFSSADDQEKDTVSSDDRIIQEFFAKPSADMQNKQGNPEQVQKELDIVSNKIEISSENVSRAVASWAKKRDNNNN